MTVPLFALGVGPSTNAAPVIQLTDWDAWTLDNNLDDGCSLQFSLRGDTYDASFITELATDVWLYRGPSLYQRFRVVAVQEDWGPDLDATVTVSAACYRRMLKARHVQLPLTFSAQSQGLIVWDLIQHTQATTNGSLGITLGSSGPAVLRDREYLVGQNIFDAIVEMTQIDNGLTWNIDPNLQLLISQPSAYPTIAMPCELGVTARRMSRPSTAERFANVAVVTGDSMTTTPYIPEAAGLPLDSRGRWERFQALGQVKDQQQLFELGDGLLEESISPMSTWRVEMEPSRFFTDAEYQLGDFISIYRPVTAGTSTLFPAQVLSRNITQDADGQTRVIITAVEVP
jgi:hypothetical protein